MPAKDKAKLAVIISCSCILLAGIGCMISPLFAKNASLTAISSTTEPLKPLMRTTGNKDDIYLLVNNGNYNYSTASGNFWISTNDYTIRIIENNNDNPSVSIAQYRLSSKIARAFFYYKETVYTITIPKDTIRGI